MYPECMKEQEKLLAQKKVPVLQSQLEEYKSALCQLQAQKQRLQNEVSHTDNKGFRWINKFKKTVCFHNLFETHNRIQSNGKTILFLCVCKFSLAIMNSFIYNFKVYQLRAAFKIYH